MGISTVAGIMPLTETMSGQTLLFHMTAPSVETTWTAALWWRYQGLYTLCL